MVKTLIVIQDYASSNLVAHPKRHFMKCENCDNNHDGTYGSGRFCSVKCARSYSTKNKRCDINIAVSKALKGIRVHNRGFLSGYDKRRRVLSDSDREKAVQIRQNIYDDLFNNAPFDDLPKTMKRKRLLIEQNGQCKNCGNDHWMGGKIPLELDHINGNNKDDRKENLRLLCPNCHALTPTWRRKKNEALVDKLVKLSGLEPEDCVGSNPTEGTILKP